MPKKEALKKGSGSVEDTDPDSWIYDSLVGFLKGPVWQVPVMSFIEQKSLSKFSLILQSEFQTLKLN